MIEPEPTIEYALESAWTHRLLGLGYLQKQPGHLERVRGDWSIDVMLSTQHTPAPCVIFYLGNTKWNTRTPVVSSPTTAYASALAIDQLLRREFLSIVFFEEALRDLCNIIRERA